MTIASSVKERRRLVWGCQYCDPMETALQAVTLTALTCAIGSLTLLFIGMALRAASSDDPLGPVTGPLSRIYWCSAAVFLAVAPFTFLAAFWIQLAIWPVVVVVGLGFAAICHGVATQQLG